MSDCTDSKSFEATQDLKSMSLNFQEVLVHHAQIKHNLEKDIQARLKLAVKEQL